MKQNNQAKFKKKNDNFNLFEQNFQNVRKVSAKTYFVCNFIKIKEI